MVCWLVTHNQASVHQTGFKRCRTSVLIFVVSTSRLSVWCLPWCNNQCMLICFAQRDWFAPYLLTCFAPTWLICPMFAYLLCPNVFNLFYVLLDLFIVIAFSVPRACFIRSSWTWLIKCTDWKGQMLSNLAPLLLLAPTPQDQVQHTHTHTHTPLPDDDCLVKLQACYLQVYDLL